MTHIQRLTRLYARIKGTFVPAATVLMYHRVVKLDGYTSPLAVSPVHFEAHMAHVRERYHPISLQELARAVQSGSIPRRCVVVTFDDGYLDNLLNALPTLKKFDVPATVFVSTEAVQSAKGFWWDELDSMFLRPGKLPENLTVVTEHAQREWHVAEGAQRWQVRREVNAMLRRLSADEREAVMKQLRGWAPTSIYDESESRAMTTTELCRMQESHLVELGAHTRSHPLLSTLSRAEQHAEIVGGKETLEGIIGRPVRSFAYPYGDFDALSTEIVDAAGFEIACGTHQGRADANSRMAMVPRFWVGDWSGAEFRTQMNAFQSV